MIPAHDPPPMLPRPATPDDAPDLARIHAAGWAETYPGMLPAPLVAARTPEVLLPLWQRVLARPGVRVALLPATGFAAMGPQRDPALAASHPAELYALYLRATAQRRGLGRALLAAVADGTPFSIAVIAANTRARAFYEAAGARLHALHPADIDGHPIEEALYLHQGRPLP